MPAASLSLADVAAMEGDQLTLQLFEHLDEAARLPEDMSVSGLLQELDRTLDGVSADERLPVAAEALTQIVSAFSERAELLLLDWEDRCRGPLVDGDWLNSLIGRSPTFELAAYEAELIQLPVPQRQPRLRESSRIRYVTRDEALAALEPQFDTVDRIVALAQPEDVNVIEQSIWQKLHQHSGSVALLQLSRLFEGKSPLLILLAVLISERLTLHLSTDSFYADFTAIGIAIAQPQ
ncbi:MAG: hypothetical protein AAF974_06020 [Cyanobacteria bacterium P01_E01_bin.34]